MEEKIKQLEINYQLLDNDIKQIKQELQEISVVIISLSITINKLINL